MIKWYWVNRNRMELRDKEMKTEPHSLFTKFKDQLAREFFEIEKHPHLTADQKVNQVIRATAILCAGVAIQPIPFADISILTPIQAFMGQKIAKIRGIDIKEEGAMEVIKFIAGMVGLGFAAQQTAIGLFKMGLPGLGGFITIPLVAGLTYGIGKAVDLYFKNKAIGRTPSKEEIIQAFRQGKREGKKIKQNDLKNIEVVNVDGKNKETY
jgi:uncharacterized protein (DUF697 family)